MARTSIDLYDLQSLVSSPCYMGENLKILAERVQALGSCPEDSHAPSFADNKYRCVQRAPREADLWSAGSCTACRIPYLHIERQGQEDFESQPAALAKWLRRQTCSAKTIKDYSNFFYEAFQTDQDAHCAAPCCAPGDSGALQTLEDAVHCKKPQNGPPQGKVPGCEATHRRGPPCTHSHSAPSQPCKAPEGAGAESNPVQCKQPESRQHALQGPSTARVMDSGPLHRARMMQIPGVPDGSSAGSTQIEAP